MQYMATIAGKQIPLRYSMNSLCAMEDLTGGALERMLERQFSAARLLLWGGMLECAPGITLNAAGEKIDEHIRAGGTLEEIVAECARAMERAGYFDFAMEGKGA